MSRYLCIHRQLLKTQFDQILFGFLTFLTFFFFFFGFLKLPFNFHTTIYRDDQTKEQAVVKVGVFLLQQRL